MTPHDARRAGEMRLIDCDGGQRVVHHERGRCDMLRVPIIDKDGRFGAKDYWITGEQDADGRLIGRQVDYQR